MDHDVAGGSTSAEEALSTRNNFLPLRKNMLLNHRYYSLWILGHSEGSSVTWLCWDTTALRFVAVKTVAPTDRRVRDALAEITKHQRINKKPGVIYPGRVVKMLDFFYLTPDDAHLENRKGTFVCIVFEVLGGKVSEELKKLTRRQRKKVMKQIVEGLCCLRGTHRLIYLNLSLEKVLFELKPSKTNEMFVEALAVVHQAKQSGEKMRGFPDVRSEDPTFGDVLKQIDGRGRVHEKRFTDRVLISCYKRPSNIKLTDLGAATYWDFRVTGNEDMMSRENRAFEVLMGDVIGYGTDVWSLACVCFELFTGAKLFTPCATELLSADEELLRQMIELLGAPSWQLQRGGGLCRKFFKKDGGLRRIVLKGSCSIRDKLMVTHGVSFPDANAFSVFLIQMLKYDFEKRPDVFDINVHEFFHGF